MKKPVHSRGGAHSVGMARAALEAGLPLELVLLFAPRQQNQFSAYSRIENIYQFSRKGDQVSSNQEGLKKIVAGQSRFGTINGASMFTLPDGNEDGRGNHSMHTYTRGNFDQPKADHPDVLNLIFGGR